MLQELQDIENIKLGNNNLTKSYSVSTHEILKLDKLLRIRDLLEGNMNENKTIIQDFLQTCRATGKAQATIKTYESFIKRFSEAINKNFCDITQKDIENYILKIKAKSSQESFKRFLKFFYKWLSQQQLNKDIEKETVKMRKESKTQVEIDKRIWEMQNFRPQYPSQVSWIKTKLVPTSRTDKDILTSEEVFQIIKVCNNVRDRAIVSLLWDDAMRIGTCLNIKIKDLIIENGTIGIQIELDGGERRILPTVDSTPYLFEWLNQHPMKDNLDAPLFISVSPNSYGKQLSVMGFYERLDVLSKRAGITKHIYPHMLRHSRTTFWKRNHVDSATIKYIGAWKMNSTIPDTVYNHQSWQNYRSNLIYATTGITPPEFKPEINKLQTNICSRCGEINASATTYCIRCKEPLTEEARKKQDEMIDKAVVERAKQLIERVFNDKKETIILEYEELKRR